jgi:Domain of unknown function (DUF4375)
MTDLINQAFEEAVALLNAEKNRIKNLPHEVVTFLRVYNAQGVIDNGGYCYFFENDWPEGPPYSEFVNSYNSIGCVDQAHELKRVVETFPFENPHLQCDRRNEFMEKNEESLVEIWGDKLCGDEGVWQKLENYYIKHKNKFV